MVATLSPTTSSLSTATSIPWAGGYGVLQMPADDAEDVVYALDYDVFVDFKINATSVLSNFAVEDGAFATYNQAQHPYKAVVTLSVVDTAERRQRFLSDIEALKKGIDLVMLATPDRVYPNAKLVSYDYARQSKHNAWGCITATLNFEEVRIVDVRYTTTKSPGAAKVVPTGQVPPTVKAKQVAGSVLGYKPNGEPNVPPNRLPK